MAEPGVLYQERYFGSAPAGYMNYKAENLGWNDMALKWKWGAFFSAGAFNSTPNWIWEIASMNWGQMLSGGEVSPTRGAQMQTTMQPSHQLRLPSTGAWHDWTDALMSLNNDTTFSCNDSHMTLSYTVRFDTYTANGTVQ